MNLICNSERLLKRNLQFTHYFLRLLYEQLNFVPLDFFSDELSKDNFLGPAMVALFSALSPPPPPRQLQAGDGLFDRRGGAGTEALANLS